jgi:hypothetical protein
VAISLSNAARSGAADNTTARLNTGYLRIFSGTRPANPDTALSGNTLLAELRFAATAFGAASNGVAMANAITPASSADATGTASFFRALASNGSTAVVDGSVGTSGADLNMNSVAIQANAEVRVDSLTYTEPVGG